MRTGQMDLFNVAELRDGVLYRFPQSVCDALQAPEYDEEGRFVRIFRGHYDEARSCIGTELRFVAESEKVKLSIRSEKTVCVTVYNGDFENSTFTVGPGETEREVIRPAGMRGVERKSRYCFSKDVWRIAIDGHGDVQLCDVQPEDGAEMRPPHAGELPEIRLLAYGSSITQGVGSMHPRLNYLNTAAQILGIDVLNKALAGGCFCEPETIDFLCGQQFDAVYLEPGTNIADRPAAFIEERISNLIDKLCIKFPEKLVFVMTPVRGLTDVSSTTPNYRKNFPKTKSIIEACAKKYTNTVLLDGHELLNKDHYLLTDILHPSGFGHIQMGQNLATMLRPYFEQTASGRIRL